MVKIIKMAKGAFTTTDITVDSSGRVIKASSGSAGGGAFEPKLIAEGPASGNHTTSGNTSTIGVYIYAGGGGGGAGGNGVGGAFPSERAIAAAFAGINRLDADLHDEDEAMQFSIGPNVAG